MGTLPSDLHSLLSERPIPVVRILDRLAEAAEVAIPDDLPEVVRLSRMHEPGDQDLAVPAIVAMPAWGLSGIRELPAIVRDGPHGGFAQEVLIALAGSLPPSKLRLPFVPSVGRSAAGPFCQK